MPRRGRLTQTIEGRVVATAAVWPRLTPLKPFSVAAYGAAARPLPPLALAVIRLRELRWGEPWPWRP